jgi:hypothetical protein
MSWIEHCSSEKSPLDSIFEVLVAPAGIAGVFVGFGALVVLSEYDDAVASEMHRVVLELQARRTGACGGGPPRNSTPDSEHARV